MNSKMFILLPVYNRHELTQEFVNQLIRQTYSNYHLILIDDGSTDGTSEMVKEYVPSVTVLTGKGDWWWAGSLQKGLEWLANDTTINDSDLVLMINDDVRFAPDYLESAVRVMKSKQGTLVLSQNLDSQTGKVCESGITVDFNSMRFDLAESQQQINCLETRGLFIHWSDVKVIGGFYPRILPHYLSDYEYTIRAYRRGLKCETSPEVVLELNHETTGYHGVEEKSFLLFLKKFFSIKNSQNPIYWTSFILLTSGVSKNPVLTLRSFARVWKNAAKSIFSALRKS